MFKYLKVPLILAFGLVIGLCVRRFVFIYAADVIATRAADLLEDGNARAAVVDFTYAIRLNPKEPRYYTGRARSYLVLAAGESIATTRSYKVLALQDMREALILNPNNIFTVKSLIPLYSFLATKDLTIAGGAQNVDPDFIEVSTNFYKWVLAKSHNDVGLYVLLYKYSNRVGIVEILEAAKSEIKDLRPDLLDWYDLR